MYTISSDYRNEIIIEKSRFICTLKKVDNEGDAHSFIKEIKKEFWDATHNCSAYLIDDLTQRSNDDGEPSGTAGLPMLEVLRKNSLCGVAVVVTRYFGGIKLGAGGLVRAYASSVAMAVEKCGIAKLVLMGMFFLDAAAEDAGKYLNIIYQQQLFSVSNIEYGARVKIFLRMRKDDQIEAELWLTDALKKQVNLELVTSEYMEVLVTVDN